ncbi:GNAT family N-acetyltransferase [Actinacidiphila yeochonensis]|uniref:GNAT family N-acetyltransferase n=1 Tax=Actinacidiphila yeochonensis TaxID=89050 RepID=UPI00068AABFC|nr:GNAT family N-acetyltransferase [Actinacidiphila yeochonensis]
MDSRVTESGATAVGHGDGWVLRSAVASDIEAIAELRAAVMRADLERLGRYDEHRVRQRLRDTFSMEYTSIIEADGEVVGSITLRPADGRQWLEHFYLATHLQGRGLGSAVLRSVLARTDAEGATVGLDVLQGSAARRLYERHGFVVEDEDPVDVFMTRPPGATAASVPSPALAPASAPATSATSA